MEMPTTQSSGRAVILPMGSRMHRTATEESLVIKNPPFSENPAQGLRQITL
jgi:hypothetical protein